MGVDMRHLYPLAIIAVLILAGIAWVNSTIGARSVSISTSTSAQFDTLQAMSVAKDLPRHQYDLY
jgi:hypothetical protein